MNNENPERPADSNEELLPTANHTRVDDAMIERLQQTTRMAANEEWLRRRLPDSVPEKMVADVQKRVREFVATEAAKVAGDARSRGRVNWFLRVGVAGAIAATLALLVMGRQSATELSNVRGQDLLVDSAPSIETPFLETFVEYTEDDFSAELAAVDLLVLELESGWAGTSSSDEELGLDDDGGWGEPKTEAVDG